MGRSKVIAVDQDSDWLFHLSYQDDGVGTPVPPEQDYVVLSQDSDYAGGLLPIFRTPTQAYTDITVWGTGLITFGAPTAAQIDFMAHLDQASDLSEFPGDYIAVGFPASASEFTIGLKDNLLTVEWDGHGMSITPSTISLEDAGGQSSWRIGGQEHGSGSYALADMFHLDGGDGDDVIVGRPASETIRGLGGNDTISGGGGANVLYGNDGDDRLTGGSLDDRLDGGTGNDRLDPGRGADTIVGGGGVDTLVLDDSWYGYSLDYRNLQSGGDVEGKTWSSIEAFEIRGGAATDYLTGKAGNDRLYGGGGRDVLDGGAGDDVLDAGGSDMPTGAVLRGGGTTLAGATNISELVHDDGQDEFGLPQVALSIDDSVSTDSGDTSRWYRIDVGGDGIQAVDFSSTASGQISTSFEITDSSGQTVWTSDDGTQLSLPAGTFYVHTVSTSNDFTGAIYGYTVTLRFSNADQSGYYDADDTFHYSYDQNGDGQITPGLTPIGANRLIGGAGNDTFYVHSSSDQLFEDAGGGTDTVVADLDWTLGSEIENLVLADTGQSLTGIGNALANTITGNAAVNRLEGGDGNDRLDGAAGADRLYGGNQDDVLIGGAGNDTLDGGSGRDTASYETATAKVAVSLLLAGAQNTNGGGVDTLVGIENLTGSAFDDSLVGSDGANVLSGGAGNDAIRGGGGTDTIDGGTGTDRATYTDASVGVTVNLLLAGAQNTVGSGTDTLVSIENLTGSSFGDTLIGSNGNNVLQGGDGDDVLRGGGGTDTLDGGAGVDRVTYSDASVGVTVNLLLATAQNTVGSGTDTLVAIENLSGSSYSDTLVGSNGDNVLQGASGDDVIRGGGGTDTIDGGAGTDRATYSDASVGVTVSLAVTAAQDTIGSGTDTLVSIENLTGSSYNDTLTGSSGNNILAGGSGNDTLDGGLGKDTLDGGSGKDTFRFTTTLGTSNVDTITAFSVADDTIALGAAVFAGLTVGALATGAFYAGSAAHDADDRILYNAATGALLFDRDGTGATYAAVQFATVGAGLAITAADFRIV